MECVCVRRFKILNNKIGEGGVGWEELLVGVGGASAEGGRVHHKSL